MKTEFHWKATWVKQARESFFKFTTHYKEAETKFKAVGVENYFIIHRRNYVIFRVLFTFLFPPKTETADSLVTWVQWVIKDCEAESHWQDFTWNEILSRISRRWLWTALKIMGFSFPSSAAISQPGLIEYKLSNIQLKVFLLEIDLGSSILAEKRLNQTPYKKCLLDLECLRIKTKWNFNEPMILLNLRYPISD